MALESDGFSVTTVVTCEGDLLDPRFPKQLNSVLGRLENILGEHLYVCKLEPWNSVRVTLSIPREAALQLRQLAREGSQQLRSLGILSVQVEGDQIISLRLAGPERQEIHLQTIQQDEDSSSNASTSSNSGLSRLLSRDGIQVPTNNPALSATADKMQFRSPNVVCPSDSVVPKVPATSSGAATSTLTSTRLQSAGPFPFTSMNQAIQSRENSSLATTGGTTATASSAPAPPPPPPPPSQTAFNPPPPYPGKHPPVTLSSPLLVNLLQNDGSASTTTAKSDVESGSKIQANGSMVHHQGIVKNIRTKIHPSSSMSPSHFAAKAIPTLQPQFHSKIVHSQLPVTINNNSFINSESNGNFNRLVHHHNNQQNQPQQRVSSSDNGSAKLHQTISTTAVLQQPAIAIAKPSAVLQNSGELELVSSHQNSIVVSNKMPANIHNSANNNNIISVNNSVNSASSSVPLVQQQHHHHGPQSHSTCSILDDAKNITFRSCSPSLMDDLTPTLTDLKESDLDQLLPTLEHDIASSPPELPEVFTDTKDRRNFLINPLTGELELQASEDESDTDETLKNVFTGLPSPVASNSDEESATNRFESSNSATDHHNELSEITIATSVAVKSSKLKSTKIAKSDRGSGNGSGGEGRDSPKPAKPTTEKIKLRLKLEKTEPVSSGYKVDVSFINTPQTKKAVASNVSSSPSSGEELRVPPLHISLRGRNHAVINNKKKVKANAEGNATKAKIRKTQNKIDESDLELDDRSLSPLNKCEFVNNSLPLEHTKISALDSKKVRKLKSAQEHREQNLLAGGHVVDRGKEYELHSQVVYNTHFKEKLKERRGSDSELVHSAKRLNDNGLISIDKKRRLSQTDHFDESHQSLIVGSTNVGTVVPALSPKLKKEKVKVKESGNSKGKEIDRTKTYVKNIADKLANKQVVTLPTGEIDMEAKFKQRLLENNTTSTTEKLQHSNNRNYRNPEKPEEEMENIVPVLPNQTIPHKDKPPEIIDHHHNHQKTNELTEKQASRSPNSGGQGEDSGIESMDALSEKSPNQASQSPHGDKTQVPDILDIEAQLAKMEGLNDDDDDGEGDDDEEEEDVNENKQDTKLEQNCCKEQQQANKGETIVKSDDPLPVRVTPPLYTYSNVEKPTRNDSPTLSDSDCSNTSCPVTLKSKSLLEQLLIDIPEPGQAPNSPSPVTRSLRTRACSKLNSPSELSSENNQKTMAKLAPTVVATAKRKRHESENNSGSNAEDTTTRNNKKSRKCSENAVELIKACMGVETTTTTPTTNKTSMTPVVVINRGEKKSVNTRAVAEESSDSDEPLIEVAGKVRKNNNLATGALGVGGLQPKTKTKVTSTVQTTQQTTQIGKTLGGINTRRSVRTTPALNTRSKGDKVQPDADVLRRKTRSSVTEAEGKRRKEVK